MAKCEHRCKHIGFKGLERRIDREYRKKGISKKKAEYIAKATAGKVAREKEGME